ncbi:MAG: hypothetical protein A3F17_07795 [Gammaproteobacteria bacterium RIFCSPHIGHO2_12_FULL_41_15]|nr:MAG: hypothetical protein A3F17_07795 [Gammaproteobacteria bacterium RIFCSPHIGHO2_12_FULL_41_15]
MGFISSLFGFVISIILYGLILRITLIFFQVSSNNHLHKEMLYYTNALTEPFSKLMGKVKITKYDWPAVIAVFCVEVVHGFIAPLLDFGTRMPLWKLPFYMVFDPLVYICNLLFFAMVLRILFNWYSPDIIDSVKEAVNGITQPFIHYSKSLIPDAGGFEVDAALWLILFKFIAYVILGAFIAHLH